MMPSRMEKVLAKVMLKLLLLMLWQMLFVLKLRFHFRLEKQLMGCTTLSTTSIVGLIVEMASRVLMMPEVL
jgi:hypothetical protein